MFILILSKYNKCLHNTKFCIPHTENNSTIFKTLNSDLTVFNKTLIATKDNLKTLDSITVHNSNGTFDFGFRDIITNSSKVTSSFTKLNNAFNTYNSNLSKSTQLQSSYIKAVSNQNTALGNYLAGLNGAKASMSGYIQSLIGAKAATISLEVVSIALNTAISMGLSLAITALVSTISNWVKEEKEAHEALKTSISDMSNATSEYSSTASTLDKLTEKYKALKIQLDNTNLSESEAYQVKSDLYDVQCDLIDNFGNEAKGIDLVNGEYREQLGLLQQINKESADSYLTKNKEKYDSNINYLTEKQTFRSEYTSDWSSKNNGYMSDDLQGILEANGLTIDAKSVRSELGSTWTKYYVEFSDMTKEEAYNLAMKLGETLRQAGEENASLLEDPYYDLVQSYLSYVTTDLIDETELNSAKENTDYYEKLSAMYSSSFGNLYNSFVEARDSYLTALQTGKDIDNAKLNFDTIYGNFENSSKAKSDEIINAFNDVKNSIDEEIIKLSNWEQSLGNSSELDILSKLKVTDDQLRGINWDDEFTSDAENAFGNLLTFLGASRSEIEQVISLLIKMGAVIGEVQDSPENGNETRIPLGISETIDALNTKLKPTMDSLKSAYQDIFTEDGFTLDNVGTDMLQSIKETIDELNDTEGLNLGIDYSEFEEFAQVLSDTSSTEEQVHEQFDKLASSIVEATGSAEISAENFTVLSKALVEMGLVNADEVLTNIKTAQDELIAQGYDLTDITEEQAKAFIEEGEASAITVEYLRMYMIQKQLAEQPINTSGDIEALESLCNSLGVTGELMENIIRLKSLLKTSETMGDNWQFSSQIDAEIESYRAKIEELASGKGGSFEFNFDTPTGNDNKKKSSSDKDTSKEFDWIERAIDNIEKQISRLNKISDSAYSSASEKNKALADQIHLVNQEIALQQKAYEGYMEKANSVGLSDDYKNLVQAGAINIEKITDKELQEKISSYQEYYDKAQETQDKINDLYEQSNDYHVSAYELHLEKLDRLRYNQSISEREYLNRKQQLYIKYYNDNVKLAEVAHEAKLELLNEEKEYLQSVANSAIDILGEQIDDLKEKQDEEVKAIEAKKKPLEDQLELLEEAKDKEDRILALQKAQYELKRAQSQRDKLTYVDGQMVYRNDDKAVRDAQKAVDDAEYDIVVGNIQDQIDAYDRQIDKVNERYETEIAKIQKVQNEWEKVIALEERSVNRVNFESMFGSDGISKLLSGDMSQIEQWKNQFAGVLKDIDLTNDGVIGAVAKEFSDLANVDLSKTTSQTQAVIDQYEVLKASVGDTTSAIGATSSENTEGQTNTENVESKEESSTLIGAMEESYSVAEGTLPAEAEMFDNIASSVQGATDAINEYKSAIESLGNSSVSGVATIGNAYADGTRHAEKGLAIVAEEKPEAIQTNDGKVLLAEKPTLLNMEGGETVYNGDETKKMLKGDLKILERADSPLLRAFNSYTPDDIMNRFGGVSIPNYSSGISSAVANSKIVNNNNKPTLTINGGINVTCPAVTSKEVMNQVSTALQREFSGMALDAYQRANITR